MVRKAEVLTIIPARGGSKSIPRKNIKLLHGLPLIAYSIAAGLRAKSVTRVIVSTDDKEIASIARDFSAEVPFLRPAKYAQDTTPDLPVFQHALKWLAENENYVPNAVVQLRPTSPFRPVGCVDQAVRILLNDSTADSVRAVVPSGQNPYKMWYLTEKGYMQPLLKLPGISEPYNMPRQKLPPTYWQTGHIDVIRYKTIMDKGSMSGKRILPLILDQRYTIDIDTPRDWARAEWLIRQEGLDMVWLGSPKRLLPKRVRLLVLDFDGVLTDNRVWVDGQGTERVAFDRSDGLGIARLKAAGVELLVLSSEINPVVAARCKKLGIAFQQGLSDKAAAVEAVLTSRKLVPNEAVYVGNDLNDLPCFPLVGCAVTVADAAPEVLQAADIILSRPGGRGAVRELSDILIRRSEA